jgi:hypothetical protein
MEPSKPWTATLILGQRLVKELGLDDSVDTLGRWMAHRVSELMQIAEQSEILADRELAKQECSELILKIWERRTSLPYGQPLAKVADFLRKFTSSPPRSARRTNKLEEKTWNGILLTLEALQEREDNICRSAAIADLPEKAIEQEREWLTENPDDLSSEESDTIEWLVERYAQLSEDNFRLDKVAAPKFANLPAKDRTKLIHEALSIIESERKELLMTIESQDKTTRDYSSQEDSLSDSRQYYDHYEEPL